MKLDGIIKFPALALLACLLSCEFGSGPGSDPKPPVVPVVPVDTTTGSPTTPVVPGDTTPPVELRTPGAPRDVLAVAGDHFVALSWSAPEDSGSSAIIAYRVREAGDSALTYTVFGDTTFIVTSIQNGRPYRFGVAAINAQGPGAVALSDSVTPLGDFLQPGAPTGVTAVAGDGQVAVAWEAPVSDGGSAIRYYFAQSEQDPTRLCFTRGALSCIVDSVLNGTTHSFTVYAVNFVAGPKSYPSAAVTPIGRPPAPRNPLIHGGIEEATVYWEPPLTTGGRPLSHYTVQAVQDTTKGCVSYYDAVFNCKVTGLDTVPYTFRVAASNDLARGPWSLPTPAVTPRSGAPSAPSTIAAAIGYLQVTVSWSVPEWQGVSAITTYHVRADQDTSKGCTTPSTTTTCTITGLSGTPYTFRVMASNATRSGPFSKPSIAVTPGTPGVPSTPQGVTATPSYLQATVSWIAPTLNGGNPITGYRVRADQDTSKGCTTTGELTCTVKGLSNMPYTFRVSSWNSVASSPYSEPTQPVTPGIPGIPTVPLSVRTIAGYAEVEVHWTGPLLDGGTSIIGYRVRADQDTSKGCVSTTGLPTCMVTGLDNIPYTFRVAASNTTTTGPYSEPSSPVTPLALVPPSSPEVIVATAGTGEATVSWSVPVSGGGSAITQYRAWAIQDLSKECVTTGARTCTVTGLTNVPYTFRVTATNSAGTSPASGPSNVVTPAPP